jgi:putative spermidine/putrescine transport system substrate-binding protein
MEGTMKCFGCLGLAAFTAAAIMVSPAAAEEQLTISSAGGAWQQAQRNAWYTPFAQKMGIKFNEDRPAWPASRRWCKRIT